MKQSIAGLGLLAVMSACLGCAERTAEARHAHDGQYPISIATTTGMVAEMVREVGGERVQVTQLMGEDVDPHIYKASPKDVSQLSDADMVFYGGLHLEGKIAEVLERMGRKKPAHAVAEVLPEDRLFKDPSGAVDAHIWFDLLLWKDCVKGVADALAKYDPANEKEYRERAAAYERKLTEAHEQVLAKLQSIPKPQRVLVTAHDAFSYFARAYDMEVRSIQGISTESEAGLKEINDLVQFIKERNVKAVFAENIISERNVQALVEGCKAAGHDVSIGGKLYSDSLGKTGTPEGTFIGMVLSNADMISQSLQ